MRNLCVVALTTCIFITYVHTYIVLCVSVGVRVACVGGWNTISLISMSCTITVNLSPAKIVFLICALYLPAGWWRRHVIYIMYIFYVVSIINLLQCIHRCEWYTLYQVSVYSHRYTHRTAAYGCVRPASGLSPSNRRHDLHVSNAVIGTTLHFTFSIRFILCLGFFFFRAHNNTAVYTAEKYLECDFFADFEQVGTMIRSMSIL